LDTKAARFKSCVGRLETAVGDFQIPKQIKIEKTTTASQLAVFVGPNYSVYAVVGCFLIAERFSNRVVEVRVGHTLAFLRGELVLI
jgi:hypothetical protein